MFDFFDLDRPVIVSESDHGKGLIEQCFHTHRRYTNFGSGPRILGIAEPTATAGYSDTFPSDDAPQNNFVWSIYSCVPSGADVVSGFERGLLVCRPTLIDCRPRPEAPTSPEDRTPLGGSISTEYPLPSETENLGDVDGQVTGQPGGIWLATVTVTVHDTNGNLQEAVTVDGSCGTASEGQCPISHYMRNATSNVRFSVDMLSHDNDQYAAASTHVSGPVAVDALTAPGPEIYWSADHETGDFSQWDTVSNSGLATNIISTERAHSGARSAELTIMNADGTQSPSPGTRLTIRGEKFPEKLLPDLAYYSVWYYFPQIVIPADTWNVFQWKQAEILSDGRRWTRPVYVVDVDNRANGNMFFALRKNVGSDGRYKTAGHGRIAAAAIDIPVARWVHLECSYKWAMDAAGQVRCWQDGIEIWSETGHITEFDEQSYLEARNSNKYSREWTVNNYSSQTDPATQSIYVDDAAISATRALQSRGKM